MLASGKTRLVDSDSRCHCAVLPPLTAPGETGWLRCLPSEIVNDFRFRSAVVFHSQRFGRLYEALAMLTYLDRR
jgi:hypothetical protein